jgi:hypothetical protein
MQSLGDDGDGEDGEGTEVGGDVMAGSETTSRQIGELGPEVMAV